MDTLPPASGFRTTCSRSDTSPVLEPQLLASLLEAWALKREKVLPLLDIRAAHHARELVSRCRRLERVGFSAVLDTRKDDPTVVEWLDIRKRVAVLIRPPMMRATGT